MREILQKGVGETASGLVTAVAGHGHKVTGVAVGDNECFTRTNRGEMWYTVHQVFFDNSTQAFR